MSSPSKLVLAGLTTLFLLTWALVIDSYVFADDKSTTPPDITNSATVGALPTPPSCGEGEHLDLSGTKCLKWELGGPPTPPAARAPTTITTKPTPEIKFSIFGYGPAGSILRMSGIGVFETTKIDQNGYFEFINPSFPTFLSYLAGNYYPELCFQATDEKNRISMPVCIPALAKKAFTPKVGPVILPPTISVGDGTVIKESQLTASGSTLPNSDVEIFVAKKSKNNLFQLVGEVSAFYLPIYKVKSDDKGRYEFSLPTNVSDEWRIFAASSFQSSQSPKSNTLTYYIKPVSYKLIEVYEDTLAQIKPKLLSLIIGLEFLILFILAVLFPRQKKEYQPAGDGKQGNIKKLQKRYEELLRSKATQM